MSQRFAIEITAAPGDIDELGHVSNLVYLRWVLEVATEHSRARGWDHAAYRALGSVFVVRRHEIDYVAQVRAGDRLVVETWVASWKLASCVRSTELRRGEQVVARAATTWAMMSIASGRPVKIPDELRAHFA
ncbi:MAG: acyl-CoA thioesterase [Deltaproteobacteria bacterium]|nr:acyl-CoA thioesterase [Deltaproteobacteria bacterium]